MITTTKIANIENKYKYFYALLRVSCKILHSISTIGANNNTHTNEDDSGKEYCIEV